MIINGIKSVKSLLGVNAHGSARPCFINAGQSNVDGAIPTANLPAPYQQAYQNVKFYRRSTDFNLKFSSLDWTDEDSYKAGNPGAGSFYANQFFLYPQIQSVLARDIYVVQHALGGTALSGVWKPTATIGQMYKDLIFKTLSLKNTITRIDGAAPDFKFFYWGQGENDARVEADANAYQTNLTNFINGIRTETGLATLPFLIAKLHIGIASASSPAHPYYATVRAAQVAVCQGGGSAISGVYLVDNDAAELAADFIHYTSDGYSTISDNALLAAIANGLI